jgi:hypothetical protein
VAHRLLSERLVATLRICGLQDLIDRQLALLLGVLSSLARSSDQEMIARKIRQLMFAGYAILRTGESDRSPKDRRRGGAVG